MTSRLLSIPVRTVAVLAVVGALALAGCGKKDAAPEKAGTSAPPVAGTPVVPPTAPTDREIKITSIKPDGGTLKTGDTVKLAISAAYTLPAQGGGVGIVVQDSKNALIANKLTQVAGGSGTVAEEIEFKVPATERIVVHVPLYLKDETNSTTVASREFTVKAK
jgi:hypothetical protein